MENLLNELVGKTIDINCGQGVVYRGQLESVMGGIVSLLTEEKGRALIAIDKIVAVFEPSEHSSRPGFIG